MRCVVEGCRPVFSLISLSDIASSREASTSISANMRSITWMVGVAAVWESFFLMARPFYLVKSTRAMQEDQSATVA